MRKLFACGVCLLLGTGALVFALRFGHRVPELGPHGDAIMTGTALTLSLSYAAAVAVFISWHGTRRAARGDDLNPGMNAETLRLGVRAGVYGLKPGASYRVVREIEDYHGNVFPAGMELSFVQRHYLPYHGGHTVVFRPKTMYLQDEENADVLNRLENYLEAAGSSVEAGRPGR